MFRPIEEVQRQYTTAIQPVQFFEARNRQNMQSQNPFNFISQTDSSKTFHLLHPNVSNSQYGGKLDLMG